MTRNDSNRAFRKTLLPMTLIAAIGIPLLNYASKTLPAQGQSITRSGLEEQARQLYGPNASEELVRDYVKPPFLRDPAYRKK